ncbi:MAG: cysteine--tRNA ligase [Clostridia bacterium]|nr:cysteine--tRNA ligase [Clostridia bacterium]MBP5780179.1 cysteine--tRNA ligase [Clostridia bacterium]
MKIYNTLSRRKEEFVPQDPNEVKIYSCGPTVYSFAHIGNMRTYVFMDSLRRVLRHEGYTLKHVMNVTDVGHLTSDADDGDDKMEKAAKKEQKSPYEIADFYAKAFFKDLARLNIDRPEIIAKATEHIDGMIDYVVGLCDKGYGYETSDGIYFDIAKFPGYGKLSRARLDEQLAGGSERVAVNDEKHNPADFALWKKAPKEHIMQWPSPWGMGYPGWHIECSEMSREYLGDLLDIHTGGVDHIPIHHENEIAQSEALIGKKTVNYWMHGEFLLVDGGKMSKSLGNTYTVDTLIERGYSPLAFRYFCLNGHYRNKLNFTWAALDAAQTALNRLYETLLVHKNAPDTEITDTVPGEGRYSDMNVMDAWKKEFEYAISDDLNIPLAMSVVWKALRYKTPNRKIYDFVLSLDDILGLDLEKGTAEAELKAQEKKEEEEEELKETIPAEILALSEERMIAKKEKRYADADALRAKIAELGYKVTDTKDGPVITKE